MGRVKDGTYRVETPREFCNIMRKALAYTKAEDVMVLDSIYNIVIAKDTVSIVAIDDDDDEVETVEKEEVREGPSQLEEADDETATE